MIFKKYISIFLSVLLLISNTSLVLAMNYCTGKTTVVSIKKFELSSEKKQCCCKNKSTSEKKCCKNNIVILQKLSDFTTTKLILSHIDSAFLSVTNTSFVFEKIFSSEKEKSTSFSFKLKKIPLFKLYNQYLFYEI